MHNPSTSVDSSVDENNVKKSVVNWLFVDVKHSANEIQSLNTDKIKILRAIHRYPNVIVSYAQAIDVQRGASLFGHACIGCHDAGGNIIQPGATLFLKDLQRNGVDTEEEIYRITNYGKGRMPGFGEMCTPRGQCTFGARLKEDEIKLLANFVKSQADQGWSNIGNNGN
ncbi:hypothetical protein L1887_07721 [Cichorium endivia]|nr:hypothetical protein L1887_07721 [Cichorium endivia]